MLTQDKLKEISHYDPETGKFTWLVAITNRVKVGKTVGSKALTGYLETQIFNKRYLLHRLVWLYVYGKMPDDQIDHINGIRDDNRLCNLREVTGFTNMQNMREPTKRNKQGFLGVSYDRFRNKFKAQIRVNEKNICLGRFDTAELAHEAYLSAKRQHHITCTI